MRFVCANSWQYLYIPYTVFMVALLLYFIRYVHGYMKSFPLFDDFRRFRVFIFCYRAYSKTQKPRKILISSFFEVLRLFIWFPALFQAFWAFRAQLSKCCSRLSMSIYYYCLKVAFLVIKTKIVLKYQIGSFSAVF